SWILAGVIVGGAVSRRLSGVVFGAVAVAVAGALVTLARAWFSRPSAYALACKVDAASGLQDRLSTALYLGASDRTDAMALRQRRDALSRLPAVDAKVLFPFRVPSFASQTLVLALIATGLLVYRAYYR